MGCRMIDFQFKKHSFKTHEASHISAHGPFPVWRKTADIQAWNIVLNYPYLNIKYIAITGSPCRVS